MRLQDFGNVKIGNAYFGLRTRLFRGRSIMLTWLVSYLTVLLLPIGISLFVYEASNRTLAGEIHEANYALLNQAREVMDNHFTTLERLSFELTWNVRVQELLYSNKYSSFPNDYPYDLYQISKDLQLYTSAYTSVDLCYIYVSDKNTVIMPTLVRDGEYAYRLLHQDDAFTYAKWQTIVNQSSFTGYVPMVRIDNAGRKTRAVAYVHAYPSDTNKPVAANVQAVDESRLLGAIEGVELFNKGQVYVLNDRNEPLVTNAGDAVTGNLPVDRMTAPSGLFYYHHQGVKYELLYMVSSQTGLKYVSIMPSRLYWEKAEQVRSLTYISIAVSLLGGILLTTFYLRRNYNPVRRLVQAFSGKSEYPNGKKLNEFHYIQQAVDHTLLQMDNIMSNMEQQRHLLKSHFIARLMKGRFDKQIPIEESLAAFEMRFESDEFAVILLYVEESGAFYDQIQGMPGGAEKHKLLLFIVANVVEELAGRHNIGYVAEIDEHLACLINLRQPGEQERMDELRRIAEDAQRFLAEHYRIHLTLSISGIHSTIESIPQAYIESLDAMEYKLVKGRKEILSYEDYASDPTEGAETSYYYPLQVEQQLMNFLKVGDYEQAKATLDDIVDRNFSHTVVSVAYARCLMLNLVSTMIKTISEIGSVQDSVLVQNPKRINQLAACETIQDMQREMTELLRTVCEYTLGRRREHIQHNRQQSLVQLVDRISSHIMDHYQDPNLNIQAIGRYFDMKPGYLSKLFKDQTGEGLLDAINKVRIDKAKSYLAGGEQTIGDAAAHVGFSDVNAFIRIFKKYEGITPGKYKETRGTIE